MKKILACAAALLMFAACSKASETLKGNEYTHDHNGTKVTLNFHPTEDRFAGKVVNNYFGTYELKGRTIKFGPLGSTMMMGPADKMKAESEYFKFMPTVDTYELKGNTLILKNKDGEEMSFEKTGAANEAR